MEFLEDGEPLKPMHEQARISLPSDTSFQSYEQALASLRGPPLPPTTDVFWNQGYFDALLEYPIASDRSSFEVDFHVSRGLATGSSSTCATSGATAACGRSSSPPAQVPSRWIRAGTRRHRPSCRRASSTFSSGWDHLLFLICLVVPFRRLGWRVVGVITAFTVAHSITLIAAAGGWVPRSDWFPPLVETLIAVSILYMAVENMLRPNLRWRWLLTSLFGLVHGFGFSFLLANQLQFAGSHLLLSLLAFNVGIELGQLMVLAVVWPPLAWLLYRSGVPERVGTVIISAFAAHAAWHWMVERGSALMDTGLSNIGVETLVRGGIATLAVAALLWGLVRILARRQGCTPGAAQSAEPLSRRGRTTEAAGAREDAA